MARGGVDPRLEEIEEGGDQKLESTACQRLERLAPLNQ